MSHFYQELAKTPNITKAQALRRAQLALLQNPSYQRPRFWAPY
ncbi:MAG: CHAT domain-containing protein, partial [Nostoc sp. ChiQUE01a]|nr:CHAT domain-containing protein [Nostoc sp. ChiQUE01a]